MIFRTYLCYFGVLTHDIHRIQACPNYIVLILQLEKGNVAIKKKKMFQLEKGVQYSNKKIENLPNGRRRKTRRQKPDRKSELAVNILHYFQTKIFLIFCLFM